MAPSGNDLGCQSPRSRGSRCPNQDLRLSIQPSTICHRSERTGSSNSTAGAIRGCAVSGVERRPYAAADVAVRRVNRDRLQRYGTIPIAMPPMPRTLVVKL